MLMASGAQEDERAAVAQRYRLDQSTSKIGSEVTALSDRAREFVVTGDPSHLVLYRREAATLRPVEERIRRVKDIGASPDELETLADAMRLADALQDEQRQAIGAGDGSDKDQARQILFGAEYGRELDRIAANIERFQYRLDQRTGAEVAAATGIARFWKASSEIVLALTGLLFLCVLFFVFRQRVLRPVMRLSDVVSRLAVQDYNVEPPDYDQIDEIGDIAQAIRMFRENGLERQRLEQERNADLAMRSLLSRMTQRMQGCETTQALERVIESFIPVIAPKLAGRLYLLDDRRNAMVETCAWLGPVHSQPEFPPIACWALQRSDLHRPAGQTIDVPCDHLNCGNEKIDSICLPLIAQRTTLGLLYLEPREDQPAASQNVSEIHLKMLAENIGLALGNLRLRDALREMAMADGLTGLANRRHLDAVLTLRVREAERLDQPISCLMVDVDHFKRFNDEFGHDAGDAVLREMGEVLKHSMRESSVAFRYGGEEFLLLMPELGPEQALRRAEEVQQRIRALRIEHGGRELGPITASIRASLSAPNQLCVQQARSDATDAALYRAKETGSRQDCGRGKSGGPIRRWPEGRSLIPSGLLLFGISPRSCQFRSGLFLSKAEIASSSREGQGWLEAHRVGGIGVATGGKIPSKGGAANPGVRVRLVQPVLVSVLARKDKSGDVMQKAKAALGLELSMRPVAAAALGLGPGAGCSRARRGTHACGLAFAGRASISCRVHQPFVLSKLPLGCRQLRVIKHPLRDLRRLVVLWDNGNAIARRMRRKLLGHGNVSNKLSAVVGIFHPAAAQRLIQMYVGLPIGQHRLH